VSLPQPYRLRRRQDFQQVYQQGQRRQSANLTLVSLRRNPLSSSQDIAPSRFGIAIGQKVSKKAVVRNRLKRRIKACVRNLIPQLKPGWDVAIIVKISARECEYEDFLRELKQLLTGAEIINGH
jgi:ribonuclease P protein component